MRLNGVSVKASREVREGDLLELTSRGLVRKIKILRVPGKQVSKSAARECYEILDETRLMDELW